MEELLWTLDDENRLQRQEDHTLGLAHLGGSRRW